MAKQNQKRWEPAEVENINKKKVAILGFSTIGSACGRVAKHGFGAEVIGIDI